MNLRQLFSAALISLISVTGVCQAAPITYNFVDYAADQAGNTLSGTITTDGTLGFLADANILSFDVQVTGPKPLSWTSGDTDVAASISHSTSVSASASQLFFHSTNTFFDGSINQPAGFTISFNDASSPGTLFKTLRYRGQFNTVVPIYEATNSLGPGNSWSTNSPIMDGNENWVIGQVVPEPSTLVLMGLGLVGVGGYHMRRRRKSVK